MKILSSSKKTKQETEKQTNKEIKQSKNLNIFLYHEEWIKYHWWLLKQFKVQLKIYRWKDDLITKGKQI